MAYAIPNSPYASDGTYSAGTYASETESDAYLLQEDGSVFYTEDGVTIEMED